MWACETYPQGAEDCVLRMSRQQAQNGKVLLVIFQECLWHDWLAVLTEIRLAVRFSDSLCSVQGKMS